MTKKHILYSCIITVFFFLGALFFLVKRDWLIVHWVPAYSRSDDISGILGKKSSPKRNVPLYYWKDEKLKKEVFPFVWLASKSEIIKIISGNWLNFVYEERVFGKRVSVESAALSASEQEVYLSLDQPLFLRELSIHKKWELLDGLCRTISGAGLNVQSIIFLVKNEEMIDDHLNFSHPWPIDGF